MIGESLGIAARDEVATKLAEDTEFRTREVIQARVAPHRCRSSVIAGSFDIPCLACTYAQLGGFTGSCEVHAPCQTDEVVSSRCEQRASNAQCRGALVPNLWSCGCSAVSSHSCKEAAVNLARTVIVNDCISREPQFDFTCASLAPATHSRW